jgi:hypothetical protein
MSSSAPIVDRIRIIPRPEDFLDRNVGSSGEVFFNRESSSLRVYSGRDRSGFEIARADLENVTDADLSARITALGITGGASGGASVDVSETAPTEPEAGNLWLNTTNGRLYIYVNDGDTSQWMQPAVPVFSGSYNDLSDKPALATVATSGSYNDLTDKPVISDSGFDGTYDSLSGKPTSFSGLTALGLSAGVTITEFSGDGALTDSSNSAVPTESAVKTYVDNRISLIGNNLTLTGLTTIQQSTEVLNALTGATGTVTHDLDDGAVFYHSSLAADFTADFINVPTTNDRTISLVLILNQGGTAYIPTAVQIDGQAQTINWQGASAPSGNANQIDVVSFTLIRTGDAWAVIGSLTTYG